MSGLVALLHTHVFGPPVRKAYERLRDDLDGLADVVVLFDDDTGNARPPASVPTHRFSATRLARTLGREHLFRGYNNVPTLDFFRAHPGYERYWTIEYDVRFRGSWATLLEHFQDSTADLITAHLRRWTPESEWPWWDSLEGPGELAPEQRVAGFHPVCRQSWRALDEISRHYLAGWRGHSEVLVPTLLEQAEMELRDLGGTGPWVAEGDRNRFYLMPPNEILDGLESRGWPDRSTYRWRPYFRKPGWRPHTLYHPVKELGWKLGHRQPNRSHNAALNAQLAADASAAFETARRGPEPRVSVILPACDAEASIAGAVDSVLAQEERDFELIVVVDGSTDGTEQVLARYSDHRLRVITTPRRGLSAALNLGIEASSAPVLSFLTPDHRFRPAKLRRELELLDAEPEVGLTFCGVEPVPAGGAGPAPQPRLDPVRLAGFSRPAAVAGGRVLETEAFELFMRLDALPADPGSMAARRTIIGDLRFLPRWWDQYGRLAFLEDLAFTPRLLRRTRVGYLAEPLVATRRGADPPAVARGVVTAQLNSLIALFDEPLNAGEERALDRRIGRQLVAVGRLHLREGRWRTGLSHYRMAARQGALVGAIRAMALAPWHAGPGSVPLHDRPEGGQPRRYEPGVVASTPHPPAGQPSPPAG